MKVSKRRIAVIAVLGLVLAGVSAMGSTSPATGAAAPEVGRAELSGPVVPVTFSPGHLPTSEAAHDPQPSGAIEGSPAGAESVTGAESVIGADGRVRVTNTTKFPNRAIGQIELVQNGQNFICTGWLIDRNSILASGHCAFNPDGGTGDVITSAIWAPGRNRGTDPYGTCGVSAVWSPPEWTGPGNPNYDFAVMNLDPGCAAIGDTTGFFGMIAVPGNNALTNANAIVQGYPGDKPPGTHSKMQGKIAKSTQRSLFYKMDTFGGQSGSPIWFNRAACGMPCGMGIHSYGVGGPGPASSNNSGPRLTSFRIGQIENIAALNGV